MIVSIKEMLFQFLYDNVLLAVSLLLITSDFWEQIVSTLFFVSAVIRLNNPDLISLFLYLVFEKYNWIQVLRNGLISCQMSLLYQKSDYKKFPRIKRQIHHLGIAEFATWNCKTTVCANMQCFRFHDPDFSGFWISCNTVLMFFSRAGHFPGCDVTNTRHVCRSVRNHWSVSSRSLFPSWYPSRMSKQSVEPRRVSLSSDMSSGFS